jgi:hypothetical protein
MRTTTESEYIMVVTFTDRSKFSFTGSYVNCTTEATRAIAVRQKTVAEVTINRIIATAE